MVILVLIPDKEILLEEHQEMTLLQDNHGITGQVVLVMDMNQVELLVVFLVLLELYLEMVDKVHGVMVHLQDQVVVLQVYS